MSTRLLSRASFLPVWWVLGCTTDPTPVHSEDETTPPPTGSGEGLCRAEVTCGGSVLDEPKAPCVALFVDAAGTTLYDGPAGLELRGRSSLSFPKPQYALELRTHSELPVWPGSSWRFLDDGSDPGPGWKEPGFDDSAWAEGPAPLGHGGEDLQTSLQPDATTVWFRRTVTLASWEDVVSLELGLRRDDGAAVWLDGVEVLRDNLPATAAFDTPALAEADGPDAARWWTADLEVGPTAPGTLAVEVHQADPDSRDARFDLYLGANGEDVPVDLLGLGEDEDWILNGQWSDRVLFRNRLAFDLFQSMGGRERYATETRFCELVLNGDYQGVYTLGEKLERGSTRLDLAKGEPSGSAFLVKLDDAGGFHENAVGYGSWSLEYPDADAESEAEVSAWLTGWEAAILGPTPEDPVDGVFAWLDLASAVDWVLLQELTKNHDAYFLSVHLWKEDGGRMHFAPWDFDLSLGYPYDDCGAEGWVARDYLREDGVVVDIAFIQAMAAIPAFREALVTRWAELRQDQLSEDTVLALVAGYDDTLAPALAANLERWPIEEVVFSTGDPEVENWLCPVATYDEEHARTVAFLRERLVWMDTHLASF